MDETRKIMNDNRVCVVVPTYNNANTIIDVITRIHQQTDNIIVVVDGCTDNTRELLESLSFDLDIVSYPKNKGKGYALISGFKRAISRGNEYAITIDSDGQHFPEDIPVIINSFNSNKGAIIMGCRNLNEDNMPSGNTFANKFSNFWFYVQTGVRLDDTQSGYRLYPLAKLTCANIITSRYEAELELLVICAWKGIKIKSVPVRVYYQSEEERVSHFRPYVDFGRISMLNVFLCFGAVLYGYPHKILSKIRRV